MIFKVPPYFLTTSCAVEQFFILVSVSPLCFVCTQDALLTSVLCFWLVEKLKKTAN